MFENITPDKKQHMDYKTSLLLPISFCIGTFFLLNVDSKHIHKIAVRYHLPVATAKNKREQIKQVLEY